VLNRVIREEGPELLQYYPARGYPPLREFLSGYLLRFGLEARPEEILIVNGSQQGFDLVARTLLDPGDFVAIEEPSYPRAMQVFRSFGAQLLPVPMVNGGLDPEHLDRILDAARTVERLVEDLGTLSVSDAGALVLKPEPVDLDVLVNESISDLRPGAEEAGVVLEARVPDDLPPVVLDPARMRGVLGNLLANALRHTPRGGKVGVSVAPNRNGVAITVVDTGGGIPPDMLPHVFERFVKDPASPGSGLGLAIARDVVAAHLGTIEASSPTGAGTTIRIWLPTA